jgi:hypothetical protein
MKKPTLGVHHNKVGFLKKKAVIPKEAKTGQT